MEKLAGEDGYHHSVKVIFDEEKRTYFTIETKKQIQFLSKEQSEAYKEMAKKDDTIYYREIEKEAFLYLNFRKYPKPTEEEIRRGLSGNICRCTGYQAMVDAISSGTSGED